MNQKPYYDLPTRLLHKGIALTVVIQVLLSFVMEHPKPGVEREAFELQMFEFHEWVGMAAAVLVILHLLYSLVSKGNSSLHALFPWTTTQGSKRIAAEMHHFSEWFRNGLPSPDEAHALASTVHGLGLLAVLFQGLTGFAIFVGMGEHGEISEGVHLIMEAHEFMGLMVMLYLVVHVGAVIWHQRLGHDVLSRIK